MTPTLPLFFIIFLEGYVVLSTELLAIRLLIPFTGSGTDTVSIIIAAVLLPLAFGYYAGGSFRSALRGKKNAASSVRRKLISNLVIAACILTFGLSYIFLDWAFVSFQKSTGVFNRIFLTSTYCLLFIVYPVYLLGQTVPLVSNYFSRERLSHAAGRILFFSTLGSFMGAVFGTLVLMTFLGVHNTVIITMACMTLLVFLLSKKKVSTATLTALLCLGMTLALNSPVAMKKINIISNNKYNTAQIEEREDLGVRILKLNRSNASAIYQYSSEPFLDYAIFVEDNFIAPIREAGEKKKILVLGAGGFALGRSDSKNEYVYVDIDSELKRISEEEFMKEPLTPNKTFVAMDARAYLLQTEEKFDMIIVDLFRDPVSVPENIVTREFFMEVREHLKDGGIKLGNYFASPNFSDDYSRNLDATLRAAFPSLNRQITGAFDAWKRRDDWTNIVYSYIHHPDAQTGVYTDDKSTAPYDRPANIPH